MLERVADAAITRPRALLLAAVVAGALAMLLGSGAARDLALGEPEPGDSPAAEASELLTDASGRDPAPAIVFRIGGLGRAGALDAAPVLDTLKAQALADPAVASVTTAGRAQSGSLALLVHLKGDVDPGEAEDATRRLEDGFDPGNLSITPAGPVPLDMAASRVTRSDALEALLIALPLGVLLVLALFAGSSLAAAGALAATIAVFGSAALLRAIDALTPVSALALAGCAVVGAALAIEHARCLLAVRRDASRLIGEGSDATMLAVIEGGGAIGASTAAALAVSVPALLLPGQAADVALGTAIAVVLAGLASLLVLPAALTLRAEAGAGPANEGAPTRRRVRGPVWLAIALAALAVAVLAAGAAPLREAELTALAAGDLPGTAPERRAERRLERDIAPGVTSPAILVSRPPGPRALRSYLRRLRRVPGVAEVRVGGRARGRLVVRARLTSPAGTAASERVLDAIRRIEAGFPVAVTGRAATLVEAREHLGDRLPVVVVLGAALLAAALAAAALAAAAPLRAVGIGVPLALVAGLPVLAAAGGVWAAFDAGLAAGLLDYPDAGVPLHVGALVAGVIPALAVVAARSGSFVAMFSEERLSRLAPGPSAALAGARGRRAALAGTVVAGLPLAALFAIAEIVAVKQWATLVLVCLLADLLLMRTLTVPTVARLLGGRRIPER